MSYKDILAVVASDEADRPVLDFAMQLAEQQDGAASALVVGLTPSIAYSSEIWVADPWWSERYELAGKDLAAQAGKIQSRLKGELRSGPTEEALIEAGLTQDTVALRARHADITVVGLPGARTGGIARDFLEGAMFGSGRPVCAVPPGWTRKPIGKSVLIAWKPTRECARALGDAAPILSRAERIGVVTVDATPSPYGFGKLPGADISQHLARKGYQVDLFNLDSAGRSETAAILDQARAIGADLVVMGGYGHARVSEFLLGGVTRDMLAEATVPVLMSH